MRIALLSAFVALAPATASAQMWGETPGCTDEQLEAVETALRVELHGIALPARLDLACSRRTAVATLRGAGSPLSRTIDLRDVPASSHGRLVAIVVSELMTRARAREERDRLRREALAAAEARRTAEREARRAEQQREAARRPAIPTEVLPGERTTPATETRELAAPAPLDDGRVPTPTTPETTDRAPTPLDPPTEPRPAEPETPARAASTAPPSSAPPFEDRPAGPQERTTTTSAPLLTALTRLDGFDGPERLLTVSVSLGVRTFVLSPFAMGRLALGGEVGPLRLEAAGSATALARSLLGDALAWSAVVGLGTWFFAIDAGALEFALGAMVRGGVVRGEAFPSANGTGASFTEPWLEASLDGALVFGIGEGWGLGVSTSVGWARGVRIEVVDGPAASLDGLFVDAHAMLVFGP